MYNMQVEEINNFVEDPNQNITLHLWSCPHLDIGDEGKVFESPQSSGKTRAFCMFC